MTDWKPTDEMRVVVADDEPIMQMYLEETLSQLGLEVVGVAGDGNELIAKCRACVPDLIITDIRMPHLDGYGAVAEICRECPMPVLFISGFDESSRMGKAEEHCIPTYLTKPVDESNLRHGIGTVLERFRQFLHVMQEEPDAQSALAWYRRVQEAIARLRRAHGLGEGEAFERLRREAELEGLTLRQAAERALEGA